MAYASVNDVKSVDKQVTSDFDEVITLLLDAASSAIDGYCNRPDGFDASGTAVARLFQGRGCTHLLVGDFVALTLVEVLGAAGTWESLDSTNWQAFSGDPKFPGYYRLPFTGVLRYDSAFPSHQTGRPNVRITARWGYAEEVPPQVRQATITQVSRWFMRGKSKWADVLANGEMGQLMFRSALDPDVKMMLTMARLMRPTI